MADTSPANIPSDDEKFTANDEKRASPGSSINVLRSPEAVAAEYGLSEKKLLRKLDLYLVPGVAVSARIDINQAIRSNCVVHLF